MFLMKSQKHIARLLICILGMSLLIGASMGCTFKSCDCAHDVKLPGMTNLDASSRDARSLSFSEDELFAEHGHDEGHHFCVSLLCAHGQAFVVQTGFHWIPDLTWAPVFLQVFQAMNTFSTTIFRPPISNA